MRKQSIYTCIECSSEFSARSDFKDRKGYCKKCTNKARWKSKEYREKISKSKIGIPIHTQEWKENHSNLMKGRIPKNLSSIQQKRKLGYGEASFNSYYNYSKTTNAKKRKIEFALSKDQLKEIVTKPCFYCGELPAMSFLPHKSVNGAFIHNGVDRIDSKIGYIYDNCVPCCRKCNLAKNTMTTNEFIEWIKRIYSFFVKSKVGK